MKIKKRLVGLMLAMSLATLPVAFTACEGMFPTSSPSDESSSSSSVDTSVPFEGVGEYYCSVSAGEYTLTIDEETCQLNMGSEELSGTYAYDGKKLTFEFPNGSSATATVDGTVLSLRRGNSTYKFYKKVMYTVSYVSTGSAVADVSVMNGKTAVEPEAPTKDGYWFIGWYKDEACKILHNFDEAVMSDVTLYARFVEKVEQQEFKVSFFVDGVEAFDAMQTRGNVIYNSELPTPEKEGETFMGWWVSTYDNAEKLSYKYDEQELGEDTVLYAVWESDAPSVSVTSTGVTWSAIGGSTYKVVIKNAAGNNLLNTVTPETSCDFDFSQFAEGDYSVEVSVVGNANIGKAYYQNKALDTVNYFKVSENRVLSFNEVKNATKYLITVSCGDAAHEHNEASKTVEVTNPVFDFSGCQMQQGGIAFTVQAVANGYVSSTSETYKFEANLASLTGLNINTDTEIATWDAVENATSYMVEIIDDGVSLGAKEQKETTVSLKGLTGNLELKVYPVARGYNSSATQTTVFNNTRLAMPVNVRLDVEKQALVWDSVQNASGYVVKVGDTEYTVTENFLTLEDEHFTDNVSVLTVKAICDDQAKTSIYSDPYTVRSDNKMNAESLVYNNGVISWDGVLGAAKYGVRINEGEELFVEDATKAQIAFTQAGTTKLEVRCYNAQGTASDWVAVNVEVYTVSFDACGGVSVDPIYKAEGDSVTLPATEYLGYTFAGWYDIPNALENNGQKQEDSFLQGASDLALYAGYTSNKYLITLDIGTLGVSDVTEVDVWYNKAYELPKIGCKDVTKVFAGWWTEPNGQGIRYADLNGVPENLWRDARDVILYASWYNVLTFTEVGESSNRGYAVSKNEEGIRYVEEITVPATYNDLPVTALESGAFSGCSNLKVINLPDTIQSIFISSDDQVDVGSAFEGCTGLKEVNVYCIDDANHNTHEVFYESDAVGALTHNNTITGKKEFAYLPAAYTGEYTIPDGVEVIPTSAFRDARITKLIIPASVIQIDSSAFASCDTLTALEFLPAADGEAEKALTLANGVFDGCSSLVNLTLPARVANLNLDIFDVRMQSIEIVGNGVPGSKESYNDVDGVLCLGSKLVYVPRGKSGAYRIPSGIYSIGEEAFANCKYITSVSIPGWVTSIEKYAFLNCANMRELTFEEGELTNPLNIAESAFYSCKLLTEVTLPAHLNELGAAAFGNTTQLKNVTVLGDGANFAVGAFADNSGKNYYVTDLYLGAGVQNVEIAGVFGTFRLATVKVDAANPYIAAKDSVLYNAGYTEILYYPSGRRGPYHDLPDTLTTIGANVFSGKSISEITIPASVTYIGEYAFKGCSSLTKIVWEEGTEPLTIEKGAFWNATGLTTLTVPARVTKIGEGAFANTSFTSVTFEDGNIPLTIEAYAFKKLSSNATDFSSTSTMAGTIRSIEFPTRLVSIGAEAFYSAFKNSSSTADSFQGVELVLPEGLTTVGNKAFAYNALLKSVSLPSTLTQMGLYNEGSLQSMLVFDSCGSLKTITVAADNTAFKVIDGVLYGLTEGVVTDLYMSPMDNVGNNGNVDIPKTVNKIWDEAFYSSKKITSVTFSEGIEGEIVFGVDVFRLSNSIQTVELPVGLKTISKQMFYDCGSLANVVIPYTVELIDADAFYDCDGLTTIQFQATPDNVEAVPLDFADGDATGTTSVTVKANCFRNCSNLTSIQLPERTRKIGSYTFYNLKLETIHIPSTVTTIGVRAFSVCSKLTSVTFAEDSQLTAIPDFAFYNCKALSEISIPASVKTIGKSAFELCAGLSKVNFAEGLEKIGELAFVNTPVTSLAFPASLKTIGDNAFERCGDLETITFAADSALTTISEDAFTKCAYLNNVVFPASLQTIEKNAFSGCTSLTNVTFAAENSVLKEIGNTAFSATAIKEFKLPETENTIKLGEAILSACEVELVHLSSGVTEVTNVFNGATVEKITVSENSVNFSAMEGQKVLLNKEGNSIKLIYTQLEGEFVVPDNFLNIEEQVFMGQEKLTKVVLPVSLKEIGESAFKNCTALEEVVFKTQEGVDHALETIEKQAFYGCTALTSIEIPENVITLGDEVFYGCTALENAKLNANITTMGKKIFYNASKLVSVEIPEGIDELTESMFYGTKALKTITLPYSLTTIGKTAFSGAAALTNVAFTFSDTGASQLKEIGESAFASCTSLTEFTIPNSVKTLGGYIFNGCSKLAQVGLPEGITTIPKYMFQGCAFTQFTIPATVKTVDNGAFNNNKKITALVIPATVTKVGDSAFQNMTALKSITFEEGTSTTANVAIGSKAFNGCTAVTSLTLSSQIKTIGTNAFQGLKITEAVVPENVTSLGANAFDSCKSLTTVTFGGTKMTTVGAKLFNACTALKNVTIREGTKQLSANMFYGCTNTSFTTLVLPSTITSIPANAFNTTSSAGLKLTSIDLSNVKTIGKQAFRGCTSLANVTWGTKLADVGEEAFSGCTKLVEADLPMVTKLGKNAFKGCTSLTTANLGAMTSTNGYEFYGCTKLTDVTLPANLTKINTYMFYGCSALKTINLPEGVSEIGASAFYNCAALTTIDLSKITKLGTSAFYGCKALTSADLSSLATEVGGSAFKGCVALADVTLNSALTSIGASAFSGCTALEVIDLPEGLTMIGANAFEYTSLKSVVIPQLVTFLGNGTTATLTSTAYTFRGCTELTSVTLPEGFQLLGGYVFMGCTSLKSVNFPASMTQIGKQAFMDCELLKEINLPAGLETIGDGAFNGCNAITSFGISTDNAYFKTMDGALYSEDGILLQYPFGNIPEDGVLVLPEACQGMVAGSSSTSLFSGCDNLKEIVFPSTMMSLPNYAFLGCTSLEKVTIPQTMMEIGAQAFHKCTNLKTLIFEDDGTAEELTFVKMGSYPYFQSEALTDVVIPARIKNIPNLMFGASTASYSSQNLVNVTLSEGIESIGENAFRNTAISSIALPSTLTSIGNYAFAGTNFTTTPDLNNVTTLGNYVFRDCKELVSATIFTGITYGDYTFQDCTALTTVTIENGVEKIGNYAFQGCTALEGIDLPESVTAIGNYAFKSTGLKAIKFPSNLTTIGSYAFQSTKLTSVVIPETVTCLTGSVLFSGIDGGGNMQTSEVGVFADCTLLESVTLPNTLLSIGGGVFKNCTALTTIDIPASVVFIGMNAFSGSSITSVDLKNPDLKMYQAFSGAKKLASVKLPEGLKQLGYKTFDGCTELKSIDIPDSVEVFGFQYTSSTGFDYEYLGYTFQNSGLESVVLPASLKILPNYTFNGCKSLTSVVLNEGLEQIAHSNTMASVFSGCTKVESIVIPKNVIIVGSYIFSSWTKTQTIYVCASKAFVDANWHVSSSGMPDWMGSSSVVIVYDYVAPEAEAPEAGAEA